MQIAPPRLPLHLIPKTFLLDVPAAAYQSKAQVQRKRKRSGDHNSRFFADFFSSKKSTPERRGPETLRFKVGGWVNLPVGYRQPISLLLIFHDANGEQALLIDEMDARGASEVLLSGEVEITGTNIDAMSIYCGGICEKSVWANNLSITRIQAEAEQNAMPKLKPKRLAS